MRRKMLITGIAGFIGRVAWERYRRDFQLFGIDDLSRPTASPPTIHEGEDHEFYARDINDIDDIELPNVEVVLHLAAQVSVTRSVTSPLRDFRTNAAGSLAVALWAQRHRVETFIYASTNKVYGDLPGIHSPIRDGHPLDPRTPYGVSKACGAMYVREVLPGCGRIFHQSCIYGEAQVGTIDQGWVAFLARSVRIGRPIVCFGDGSQIRDLLHVDDLLSAYDLAIAGKLPAGEYVTGGGITNSYEFEEVVSLLGGSVAAYEPWRPHDQSYFVSGNCKLTEAGWRPTIAFRDVAAGLVR